MYLHLVLLVHLKDTTHRYFLFSSTGLLQYLSDPTSQQAFKYNGRVGTVLVPSLAVLAGYGGPITAAILMVGFMSVYILDAMRLKEASFGAAWLTLGLSNMSMIFSTLVFGDEKSTFLAVLIFLLNTAALYMTGLWVTLQFKWIQLQHPPIVMAFEKMVISGAFSVGFTVLPWGIISGVGMSNAPFYMAGLGCVLYHLFARPLPSSFQQLNRHPATPASQGRKPDNGNRIQGPIDAAFAFFLAVLMPGTVYAVTHHLVLFQWVHFWSLLLLFSAPVLILTTFKDGMWWLGSGKSVDALRRLLLLISLGTFLAGLEGRIIFYGFGQYIRLTAPWSYIAVTITVYGLASLVLLHFSGALGQEVEGVLVAPLLMLSAALGSLAAGVPIWVLPAPLLAAAGLAMFYETRLLRDYSLFTIGGLCTGGWFLWHHFSFLDIELDGMKLHLVCSLVLAAMVPGLFLPGLIHAGARGPLVSMPMFAQAALLCVLEEKLFAGDHEEVTYNVHSMYPAFLVVLTSVLGMAMVLKLQTAKVIGGVSSYVLQSVYLAKLAMLALPEAKMLLPALGLVLAITPPLLLQQVRSSHQRALPPWAGLGLAFGVLTAVVAGRFAIFDILQFILDRRPSEALVAGTLMIAAAAGCLPLITRCYPAMATPKHVALLAIVFGAMLILLRPPLPIRGGSECPKLPFGLCPRIWNEEHVPGHEEDDVAIYGEALRRREHWPLWLLIMAVVLGLGHIPLSSPKTGQSIQFIRAFATAALVGGYLALDFFLDMFVLQSVVMISALISAAFLLLLQVRGREAALLLAFCALSWSGSFAVAFVAAVGVVVPPVGPDASRLFPDGVREVEEERREAVLASVLAVYASEALLLAFALKLRVSAAAAGLGGPTSTLPIAAGMSNAAVHDIIDKAVSFFGQCMPAKNTAVYNRKGSQLSTLTMQRLGGHGLGWVPTWCNLMTLTSFGLALWLSRLVTGGADAVILMLAPVLLLLTQDAFFIPRMNEQKRYFPPALAITCYLTGSALMRMAALTMLEGDDAWDVNTWFMVKNGLLLLICLPSQIDFLAWLWSRVRAPAVRMVLLGPWCVASVLAADLISIKIMGVVSLGAVGIQAAWQATVYHKGRRVI